MIGYRSKDFTENGEMGMKSWYRQRGFWTLSLSRFHVLTVASQCRSRNLLPAQFGLIQHRLRARGSVRQERILDDAETRRVWGRLVKRASLAG